MNSIYLYILTFLISNIHAYTYYSEVGMYYKAHPELVAWNDAVKICESEGASLAMPRNKEEVDVLLSMFSFSYLMLGFHSLFTVHKFTTINDEDLQYYYNIWDANQPNKGVGMCGYISKAGKLHDGQCKQNFPFVCEKQTSSRKKSESDPNCLIKDTEYRYAPEIEKCYKIHMNPETFVTAEKICKIEGGHLAIIRNKEEETFLTRMFKEPKYSGIHSVWPQYAFVGVYEKLNLGTFKTVLNELFSDVKYANLYPRKDKLTTQNCLSLYKLSAQLDNYACETPGFFICEQPSIKAKNNLKHAMPSTSGFNAKQDGVNFNVLVNTFKSDCLEPVIDVRNIT